MPLPPMTPMVASDMRFPLVGSGRVSRAGARALAPGDWYRRERAVRPARKAGERRPVVLLEDAEPVLFRRGPEELLLALEQLDRVEVVSHHPPRPQVPRGRHDVGEEDGPLAAALDFDELGVVVVAADREDADARDALGRPVDGVELPGG